MRRVDVLIDELAQPAVRGRGGRGRLGVRVLVVRTAAEAHHCAAKNSMRLVSLLSAQHHTAMSGWQFTLTRASSLAK